jgi:hypothetical protein
MASEPQPPRPVRLVTDADAHATEAPAPVGASLDVKVDTAILDVRALHATARDTREIARAARAIAGRVEGLTTRALDELTATRSEIRALGASLADMEAALIVREARSTRTVARRTAATSGGAVAGVYVAIEIARMLLGG